MSLWSHPCNLSQEKHFTEEARLDVRAEGFWGGQCEWAFFDVRVFNPSFPINRSHQLTASYCRHEQEKQHAYEKRV